MSIGIDLGTTNTAIVKVENNSILWYETLKQQKDQSIELFALEICSYIDTESVVAVDSDLSSFIYLPGPLLNKALYYFLSGAIFTKSKKCFLVSPDNLRDYFNVQAGVSKNIFHKTVATNFPRINTLPNSHVIDAYLLAIYASNM